MGILGNGDEGGSELDTWTTSTLRKQETWPDTAPVGWSKKRLPRMENPALVRVKANDSGEERGATGVRAARLQEWLDSGGQEGGHDEKVERWRWIGRVVTCRGYFHLPSVGQTRHVDKKS